MAFAWRFLCLASVAALFIGCETIPQHKALDTYPASGPTGVRMGINYGNTIIGDEVAESGPFNGKDVDDMWEDSMGFALELPIDYNPYWGGFIGAGYEVMKSEKVNGWNFDDLKLMPFYIGLTARYPFWLDTEAWEEAVDPIWLPNKPVGPAVYIRALGGGSALLNNPQRRNGATVIRTFDRQIFPFVEADIGAEYRFGRIGTWAEIGYRHHFIANPKDNAVDPSDFGQVRIMGGLSFYLW